MSEGSNLRDDAQNLGGKMININEVIETNKMVDEHNLDVRTITLGISLLDCADKSLDVTCEKIYNKIWSDLDV